MRKILSVVLFLSVSPAFALSAPAERALTVPVKPGTVRVTDEAADALYQALPVAPTINEAEGSAVKQTPNVTCTFFKSEDHGYCDIATGM